MVVLSSLDETARGVTGVRIGESQEAHSSHTNSGVEQDGRVVFKGAVVVEEGVVSHPQTAQVRQ